MPRLLPTLFAILLLPAASVGAEPAAVPTFERDVLPILGSHCRQCHGGIPGCKADLGSRRQAVTLPAADTPTETARTHAKTHTRFHPPAEGISC